MKMTIPMYKRGDTWYADLRSWGKGRVSTGRTSQREAYRWAQQLVVGLAAISGFDEPRTRLAVLISRAYTEHYAVKKPKGLTTHRSTLHKLMEELGEDTLVVDMTTQAIAKYRDKLVAGKVLTNATINRRLAYLSKCLKLAAEWGYLVAAPNMPGRLQEGTERHRELSKIEEDKLGQFFEARRTPWMTDLMWFLVETGARLSEAMKITDHHQCEAIEGGLWFIPETKAGKPRIVPLTDKARACLKVGSWFGYSKRAAQNHWDAGRKFLGLTEDAGFVLHCLRHTCASRMLQKGATLEEVSAWLGHSGLTVTRRYAKVGVRNLEDLRDRLDG